MASSCFCTSLLKFISIKENECEQCIRNGDNLHVTEGVTWAQTSHWIVCLTWPRVCITFWEIQVQCTTWIGYEDLRQNPVIATTEEKPWSLKSPVKTTTKLSRPQTLPLSHVVFCQFSFPLDSSMVTEQEQKFFSRCCCSSCYWRPVLLKCVCQVCERSDELLVNMGLSDFSH